MTGGVSFFLKAKIAAEENFCPWVSARSSLRNGEVKLNKSGCW